MKRHLTGTEFELKADPIRPVWGLCDMTIGALDMADADVADNLNALFHQICTYRTMSPTLGTQHQRCELGRRGGGGGRALQGTSSTTPCSWWRDPTSSSPSTSPTSPRQSPTPSPYGTPDPIPTRLPLSASERRGADS